MNLLDALMWLWCLIGTHASELSFFVTLFATFYIPEKMMNNQLYAGLITEYREPEIGEAVIAVIDFYTTDCKSDVEMIEKKYVELINKMVNMKIHCIFNAVYYHSTIISWQRCVIKADGLHGFQRKKYGKILPHGKQSY